MPRIDRLGALLSLAGALALACLPFVVFKANRILDGDPRALLDVLPAWVAFVFYGVLAVAAFTALRIREPALAAGRRAGRASPSSPSRRRRPRVP